jgi:methyl-accepting chemotaxis protein
VVVVVLGGDEIEARSVTASLRSTDLLEVVPAGRTLARAADEAATRGLTEFTCLVFAPGFAADGESVVAAVRKGVGPRVQLAGGLTGDDLTLDRTRVFADGEVRGDCAVLTGIFTTKPLGLAARHGYLPVGPTRKVTRSDGPWLVELDGRPAFEVWVDDARAAGLDVPVGRGSEVVVYLANHFCLGLLDQGRSEPVLRSPVGIRDAGEVRLSGGVGEGKRTRFMLPQRSGVLEASGAAARAALEAAGEGGVQGGLVLACTGRMVTLGSDFPLETASIASTLGAPIGGACVFGEIARTRRDTEAFHNATVVVLAIPASS